MAKVITKAQPSIEESHRDQILTNISVAYIQDTTEFIADAIFPEVPVQKKSDKYFVYDKEAWFRDEAKRRPDATESAGTGYTVSDDSYMCEVYAIHKDVGAQARANTDEPLDADADATEFVTHKILLKRENDFVGEFLNATPWDKDKSGVTSATPGDDEFTHWDDYDESQPLIDVSEWKREMKRVTGFMPNGLAVGGKTWDALKNHPDIIELVKYSQVAINLRQDLIAQALDIDRLVIAEGIHYTGEEGDDNDDHFEEIVEKDGLLYYAAPNPGLRRPSAGYIFTWNGYLGNPYGVTIGQFWMQQIKADRIEAEMAYDMKVVGSDLGMFLEDLVE